jgi:anti-anti-sigma regulatory factor
VKIDLERSENRAALIVGGRLTASAAGTLRDALLEAFAGAQRVELALRDVEEADLTFLQLVCAAHRTAAAREIVFGVTGLEREPSVTRLVGSSGARPGGDCPPGCPLHGPADAGTPPAGAADRGGQAP